MSPPLRDPTSDSEDDDPDYAPPEHQGMIRVILSRIALSDQTNQTRIALEMKKEMTMRM